MSGYRVALPTLSSRGTDVAGQIAVLGAIAGVTIFLGLPLGRLSASLPRVKTGLNAVATGILMFLLWDVLTHAWEPIDKALGDHEVGGAVTNRAVLAVTVGVGLLGLVWLDTHAGAARRAGRAGAAAAASSTAPDSRTGAAAACADDRDGNRVAQLRRGVGDR